MIPGEYFCDGPPIELNGGRHTVVLEVNNTGDRPVQVGSHYHFFEVNRALVFDRKAAFGMRLDLPAGTAVRFEPGEIKGVRLTTLAGRREVYGGSGLVNGRLDDRQTRERALDRLERWSRGELAVGPSATARPKSRAKTKKTARAKKATKARRP